MTQLNQAAQQLKQAMAQTYMQGYGALWTMGAGLTPKQAFAALGTQGAATLIRGQALSTFLQAQYPDLTLPPIPPQYGLTLNPDGSVTIVEND